jgi:hypothetical protein
MVECRKVADFCRTVLPEPAIRQIIGKSIESAGRPVKVDPYLTVVNDRFREG